MNITSDDYPVKVFKNENGYYSLSLSDKKQDGNYVNWYKNCQFKKDVELENKTDIRIKKAWLKCNEVNGKKYEYIFISEFEVVNEQKQQQQVETKEQIPFTDNQTSDDDLPF